MAIPLVYNVRSLRARWTSTVVAVLGIAGTVAGDDTIIAVLSDRGAAGALRSFLGAEMPGR